jgi:CRP-like cAMP-binding protein
MMFGRRSLADGEILCREGDAADCIFAIAEGEIDVFLADNSPAVARRLPGDVVGEFGMFLPRGRSATLRARGPSSVLTLDYEHFKRFLLAFPQSMLSLLALCVSQLHAIQTTEKSASRLHPT